MDHAHKITLSFAALLIVCVALALALPNVAPLSTPVAARENLRDLSGSTIVEILDATRRSVLRGELQHVETSSGEILKSAQLIGEDGNAVGKAEVEIVAQPNGARVQELEVDVDGLAVNAPFIVLVDGEPAGGFWTDAHGGAELERYGRIAPVVRSSD